MLNHGIILDLRILQFLGTITVKRIVTVISDILAFSVG